MNKISYPPGFRARRGLNWGAIGFMYASYYMCRYNFRFAGPGMNEEFGFDKTDLANIWVIWSLAYGTGQLVKNELKTVKEQLEKSEENNEDLNDKLNEANRQRTAQLLNKTNQMNLRTRRMTEVELSDWAHAPTRRMWTFRVADKFGDSGLTGIASLELDHDTALVADFVLSCRVMGKRVEETIVHQLVEGARALGASRLVAHYEPTKKNAPCLEFWQRSGFERSGERVFTWDLSRPYPKPRAVELRVAAG
jgi:hypothetical protein